MELWTQNSSRLTKSLDMDILLQILERYAEDEVFFEKDLEIE
jgi:hypothetical protein